MSGGRSSACILSIRSPRVQPVRRRASLGRLAAGPLDEPEEMTGVHRDRQQSLQTRCRDSSVRPPESVGACHGRSQTVRSRRSPMFPTIERHERIPILRTAHPVEGCCGSGEPTPAKDLRSGRVELASGSWRCFPDVGAMALGHRPQSARRPDRRNATAPLDDLSAHHPNRVRLRRCESCGFAKARASSVRLLRR